MATGAVKHAAIGAATNAAKRFLLPEDVRAEHAKQVLDFINQAPNAQIIAEAIEFPDELDVGVRIGQRIVSRRAELNGFSTLDQLYAVPYIGPERFTEIVVSLSGARPPRVDTNNATAADVAELQRAVAALRALLQPSAQARLWSVQGTLWLGQSATVLAQVNGPDGAPLVDQPITVTTSWGELDALNGVLLPGNTVVTRTNNVGLVQLQLRPQFQAQLSAAQRLALDLNAGSLPLAAPWPTAASAELAGLVVRYRAPASSDLREAIDAVFREYGSSLAQTQNRGQALAQWAHMPVNLVCFVHDEPGERGQLQRALATHTLMVRNWLPAFLATFASGVGADDGLVKELQRAPRAGADATKFLNDVFVSVQSFVNTEQGELGKSVRNRAAQQELQQFLQTNVATLPDGARLAALAGVHNASKTIGDGGLTLFTAVDVNRRDSTTKFDLGVGAFDGRLGTLERDAAQQTELNARLDTRVTNSEARFTQQLDSKADRAGLDALTAENRALRQDINAITVSTNGLRTDFINLNTSFNGLNTRVIRDVSSLGTRVDGIDVTLRGRG